MNRFSSTNTIIKSLGHAISGKNAEITEAQFVLRLLTFSSRRRIGNFWHKVVPTEGFFWRGWHNKKPRA
jgi:hypothetical protein